MLHYCAVRHTLGRPMRQGRQFTEVKAGTKLGSTDNDLY